MTAVRIALETMRWLTGTWLLWKVGDFRRGRTKALEGSAVFSSVAVIIPARNEATRLPGLLGSLAAQEPSPQEILVVDDGSSDGTAGLAEQAGVRVEVIPDGSDQSGKAGACARGAEMVRSDVLVFLDADVVLDHPASLAQIVDYFARMATGGMLSVQPFHVTIAPYESLSAFFNVLAMMGTGAFTPLGQRHAPVGAFGPCLVCRRHDYELVGGHGLVRGRILDDVALARLFRDQGRPVKLVGGRGAARFRMYPGGLIDLVEGWTKNFAAGAVSVRPLVGVATFVWVSGLISAPIYLVGGLAGRGATPVGAAVVIYAAYAGQLAWMLGRLGRFRRWTAPAFPVPLAFFLEVFARSVVLTGIRGRVRWKGRDFPVGWRGTR